MPQVFESFLVIQGMVCYVIAMWVCCPKPLRDILHY